MVNTPRMISVDVHTNQIWEETQYLSKAKGSISKEICRFVNELHEKLTKPIKVKDTISLESFRIFEKFLKEDVERLSWHQRRELSIAFNERRWELEHIIDSIHKDRKIQEQDTKEIEGTKDKKKYLEKVVIVNESLDEGEVVKEEVITE